MLDSGPPTEHRSGADIKLLPDGRYHLAVGSTEMGNGSVTSHRQIAASMLGTRAERIEIINADTDLTPYDTGTFASTGTVVAGQAVGLAAAAVRDNIIAFASRHTGVPATDCRLEDEVVVCGERCCPLPEVVEGRYVAFDMVLLREVRRLRQPLDPHHAGCRGEVHDHE